MWMCLSVCVRLGEGSSAIFGVDATWFVLIVVSCLLILSAIIVGISICVCRRREDNNLTQNATIQCKDIHTKASHYFLLLSNKSYENDSSFSIIIIIIIVFFWGK